MRSKLFITYSVFLFAILFSISGISFSRSSKTDCVLINNPLPFSQEIEPNIEIKSGFSIDTKHAVSTNYKVKRNKDHYKRVKTQSYIPHDFKRDSFSALKKSKLLLIKSIFADLQYLKFLRITKMLC
ncbi:MAG TPA: hypothetical protein PKD83_06625 [Ignavibacteria bacterium]|nr:hypothetical protein [Ignavibacteria bacterium]